MVSDDTFSLPDYGDTARALSRCGLTQSPAEAHGFALGLALSGLQRPLQTWQRELYSDFDSSDVLAAECRQLLDLVFAGVFREMPKEDRLQLSLLLPSGVAADSQRLTAVRDWCQGFLYGIGLGGEGLSARLSTQAGELLGDLAELTRMETDGVEDNEENRAALMEIEEYVWVGVTLIRDELSGTEAGNESQ